MDRKRVRRKSESVERRQAERRDGVLDVALALVEERGLNGLTASAMAEATGTVPAALYRTFPSMDALKGALVSRALESLYRRMQQNDQGEPLARVKRWVRMFFNLRLDDPASFRLIDLALSAAEPIFADDVAADVEKQLDRVLSLVASALDDADLAAGDSRLRTLSLLALVHGASHLEKRDRLETKSRSASRVLDDGITALFRGWAKR
jgi:AcrR family transcriptional regulator